MENNEKDEDDSSRRSNDGNSFGLVDSRDLDKDDLEVIKGDCIGDTIYSGKWIIKTLISLSKVYDEGWSKSLEDDLCTLWDMTAEKDVVLFLQDNDFLKVAEFTLKISQEPRLTEIIIGIIGNMCCQPDALEAVADSESLVSLIFGFLSTDDTETLVQIVRLLKSSVLYIETNPDTKWLRRLKDCEFLCDAVFFILQSSTNEDLLTATVDLLKWISMVKTPGESNLLAVPMEIERLVPSLVESFEQLISKEPNEGYSNNELKFIENWLSVLSNIIESEDEIYSRIRDNVVGIREVVSRILQPFEHSDNLFPIEDRIVLCIHNCVEILFWFQSRDNLTDEKTIRVIVTILHELRSAFKQEFDDERFKDTEDSKELVKFLEKYWLVTVSKCNDEELARIIQMTGSDIIRCLTEVANENSHEFPGAVSKLSNLSNLEQ